MNTNRNGVSIIIVLGLLAVLAVLAAAFALSMRVEQSSGRGYVHQVQARHLIHVALTRAIDDIDDSMLGSCYPIWVNRAPVDAYDAMASGELAGGSPGRHMVTGEASNAIPRALWPDVTNAAATCNWIPIDTPDGVTNGRIAYVVVNCSGLIDANAMGIAADAASSNIMHGLTYDIVSLDNFFDDVAVHRRYETVMEMAKINIGVTDPVSNLFVHSYDPGPDVYFTKTNDLGSRHIQLFPKHWINNILSYTNYANPGFATDVLIPLTNLLVNAGFSNAEAVAWNIVNYVDTNRIPECGGSSCEPSDYVSEAIPLVNEIVVQGSNTNVQVIVELWFPFYPVTVEPGDNFTCQIQVFTNTPPATPLDSNTFGIGSMAFGEATEFVCFTNSFSTAAPVSVQPLYVLARVRQNGTLVDEAVGGHGSGMFHAPSGWSANDPRANGMTNTWELTSATNHSLGHFNPSCNPWANGGQGLPIFHRDGPMAAVGEIGHIYCSYANFYASEPWQNIDLLDQNRGSALLDWMTVSSSNMPARGRVGMGTDQDEVLRALFHRAEIGHTNTPSSTNYVLDIVNRPPHRAVVNQLIQALDREGKTFREVFGSPSTPPALTVVSPYGGVYTNRELVEDAIRPILGRASFRQNIFTIILAAQALSRDLSPVAEKRALAIVRRDSYTGKSATVFFKWLGD